MIILVEDRLFKRPFSFPMAPRTRQSTALGALESVFGGGCSGSLQADAERVGLARRIDKASARLNIEASDVTTLSQ